MCDTSDVCHTCDTHGMCHTVTQCDTMAPKSSKTHINAICLTMRELIYVTLCDTFVALNVFEFIGQSNDGRMHGRGTYLLLNK
jgi:hypothetical protein